MVLVLQVPLVLVLLLLVLVLLVLILDLVPVPDVPRCQQQHFPPVHSHQGATTPPTKGPTPVPRRWSSGPSAWLGSSRVGWGEEGGGIRADLL